MTYYEIINCINDSYIAKRNITVNKEKLAKIRKDIIKNCSIITHNVQKGDSLLYSNDEDITNYKETYLGKEPKKGYAPERKIYLVEYDRLRHPYIVNILQKVINDDENALRELITILNSKETSTFNNAYDLEKYTLEKEQEELLNSITDKKSELKNSFKLHIIKNRLYQLEINKLINKKQKNVTEYYEAIRNSLIEETLERRKIDEINKILEFLDLDINKENTESFNKSLTRIRKKTNE